jgi:ubiquinol-cytochrome c reductase iron-sulfur subunit
LSSEAAPRRDFLVLVAGGMAAVGAAAMLWPFIDSLNPAADTLAAGAPIDVDISPLQPGQQITVLWQSKPVFIVNRTAAELGTLQDPKLLADLRDPSSEVLQQAPYAANWHRSIKPEFLVLVGICTHLGCIPKFTPGAVGALGPGWQGGYFCPCHGSRYDLAGRVFKGVPAPYNLPVPPYTFVTDTMLRIGESPPNVKFEFSAIEQL